VYQQNLLHFLIIMTSLPDLPMEVWVNVFGNLDYLNLKVCAMVSKTFDSYTKHRTLDDVLSARPT